MKEEISRKFIESPVFTRKWFALGLTDAELLALEIELLKDPKCGDVMQGTGRLRKYRIAVKENAGKSGGARVLYIDFEVHKSIFLVDIFEKKEKENLTKEERNKIKKAIPILEKELFGGKR